FYRPVKAEDAPRFLFQKMGNDRDGIGMPQSMMNGGPVARISAEQGRIRAMQCSHDAWLLTWRQHRASKDRGGRMRHGVMNMEDVELMVTAHFRHFYRKRQSVIGILEQSVVIDYHRVKEQSWRICGHPERSFVADEMHFVPTLGQLFAERRGKNSATANGRIASD